MLLLSRTASITVSALRPRFLHGDTASEGSYSSNVFRIPQGECQLVILSIGNVLSLSNFFYCVYKQRSDCCNFFLPFSLCNDLPCLWVQPCPMREQPELGPVGPVPCLWNDPCSHQLSFKCLPLRNGSLVAT